MDSDEKAPQSGCVEMSRWLTASASSSPAVITASSVAMAYSSAAAQIKPKRGPLKRQHPHHHHHHRHHHLVHLTMTFLSGSAHLHRPKRKHQHPTRDMKHPKSPEPMDSAPPKEDVKDDEEEAEEEDEGKKTTVGHRAKRERRPGGSSATMCQICNIQLNSSAQAQIHYRGKTHQRRLRRLAKVVSAGALTQNQIHPLLGSLPLPGRPLQPQTQLEHFLPLRVNGSTPLSLFPNFNAMDPVQKAVINHTFGSAPPKKKPIISCNICHLRFNSTTQAEAHYKGHKHARKLKALETQRNRQKNSLSSSSSLPKDREKDQREPADSNVTDTTGSSSSCEPVQPDSDNGTPAPVQCSSCSDSPELSPQVSDSRLSDLALDSPSAEGCSSDPNLPSDSQGSPMEESDEAVKMEEGKEAKSNKKPLHCPTCKVTVNSSSQLEAHCSGSKHKQMVDGQSSSPPQRRVKMALSPRPTSRMKPRSLGSKTRAVMSVSSSQPFHCELCQVSVNSETQLKQHMNSRRHKERLAGKPVKPKFTPYNKLQPSAILATKLALQKQLSKALPAGFLTSPLNPAALCTMASGPLALRLPPGPAAIIQGPLISPTLFRPAPGPLRATHTPIIFSPY